MVDAPQYSRVLRIKHHACSKDPVSRHVAASASVVFVLLE